MFLLLLNINILQVLYNNNNNNIHTETDDSAICYKALNMEEPGDPGKQDTANRPCCLHPWTFKDVVIPNNTQDIFRLLKSLQVQI